MKKLILALALTLSIAGCQQFRTLETAFQLGSASVANPVTPERLYQIESTISLVFVGLNTWKRTCVAGLIPDTCKQQIRTVQVYTLQIKPYLRQLRAFVKQNDQVNANVVFNQLTDVIGIVRAQAAAGGQNLGS